MVFSDASSGFSLDAPQPRTMQIALCSALGYRTPPEVFHWCSSLPLHFRVMFACRKRAELLASTPPLNQFGGASCALWNLFGLRSIPHSFFALMRNGHKCDPAISQS